ncbi:hypothetical protein BpHYR1_015893 [Brachionus plicatilis]|uniref:Uncharacterized protein n=1 Tax=Brachionus plicatilis TaxID=10195 RepID=A0A3M7Q0Z0_BRAPC|nr:hypothetical protein BpHYR1_015893 [Brachionus plicatilis]
MKIIHSTINRLMNIFIENFELILKSYVRNVIDFEFFFKFNSYFYLIFPSYRSKILVAASITIWNGKKFVHDWMERKDLIIT